MKDTVHTPLGQVFCMCHPDIKAHIHDAVKYWPPLTEREQRLVIKVLTRMLTAPDRKDSGT